MISGVRRVEHSEHVSVYGIDDLAVVLPHGEPNLDDVDRLDAALRAFAAGRNGSIALLIVIPTDARPPSGPARERAREMFGGFAVHVRAFATVIEGAGFLAAAKRSVLTFVSSVLRGSVPGKVFADREEARGWLEQLLTAEAHLTIPSADRLRRVLVQAQAPEAGAA